MPSVTTHHSYGSRVGNSLKNIFRGIVLVIGSIVLLVWNENNYVQQKKALEEWASLVQEATANQINPDLEWKEIHISGETASDAEALQDNTFGVITDDLKLRRTVEMYQWYEESSESCTDNYWWSEDCTTTYNYYKKWSDDAISSSSFYESAWHENPSTWEFNSSEQVKSPITLWVYKLTSVFTEQLTNYKPINLSEQNINIPEKYRLIADQTTTQTNTTVEDNNNSYLYGDSETQTPTVTNAGNEKFHINSDYIYIWTDPSSPTIWDLKISFSSVKPGTVSIVWKQSGNELSSYTVSNGRGISLLEEGNVSAADMFLNAQKANKMMTWIIRLIWLLLMYCGFAMLFQFIETLAKVLPFLANIIGVWTSIIALWLTLIVGFLTIGIAWLAVRPVVGICCLVVAAGWIFLLIKAKKNKKENGPKEEVKEEKAEPIEEPKE